MSEAGQDSSKQGLKTDASSNAKDDSQKGVKHGESTPVLDKTPDERHDVEMVKEDKPNEQVSDLGLSEDKLREIIKLDDKPPEVGKAEGEQTGGKTLETKTSAVIDSSDKAQEKAEVSAEKKSVATAEETPTGSLSATAKTVTVKKIPADEASEKAAAEETPIETVSKTMELSAEEPSLELGPENAETLMEEPSANKTSEEAKKRYCLTILLKYIIKIIFTCFVCIFLPMKVGMNWITVYCIVYIVLIIFCLNLKRICLCGKKIIEVFDEICLSVTAIGISLFLGILIFPNEKLLSWGNCLYDYLYCARYFQIRIIIHISCIIVLGIIATRLKIFNIKSISCGQRSTLLIGIMSGGICALLLNKELHLLEFIYNMYFIGDKLLSFVNSYNNFALCIYNYIQSIDSLGDYWTKYVQKDAFYPLFGTFCVYVSYFVARLFVWHVYVIRIWLVNTKNAIIDLIKKYLMNKDRKIKNEDSVEKNLKTHSELKSNIFDKISIFFKDLWFKVKCTYKKSISWIKNEWKNINIIILEYFEEKIIEEPIIEEPIDNKKSDKLGFNDYAFYYAEKIVNNNMHTFAILGRYGMGKSSFANLMWNRFHELEASSVCVKIDTWGIPNDAIMGYIIQQIQNELNKYADTLRISQIDDKYQQIIFPKSPFLRGWVNFLKDEKSQAVLIQYLDDYLESIGKKIFVVIEDFDRIYNQKLFANIAAMIDFCKKTNNIYMIIPVSDTKLTQLIIRCCVGHHYLSSISNLPDTKIVVEDIINRYYIKKQFNKEAINEEGNKYLKKLIVDNLTNAIESPRILKSLKNHVSTKWDKFQGNIDFADFCVFHLLELTRNNVNNQECSGYAYIIGNFEEIFELNQKYELFKNVNVKTGLITLENAIIEKKKEILKKPNKGPNEEIDLSYLNKVLKEINKIPERQQKLIALLIYLAIKDKNGQHLLNTEYTNYWQYLETGLFNIKGKMSIQKDTDIIKRIKLLNNGELTPEKFNKYFQDNKIDFSKKEQHRKNFDINGLTELLKYELVNYNENVDFSCDCEFINKLITWFREYINNDEKIFIEKSEEIMLEIIKKNIISLKTFKEYYIAEADNSTEWKNRFNNLLLKVFKQYFAKDNNSEHFVELLIKVPENFLYTIIFDNFNYDISPVDKWRFLGDCCENAIKNMSKKISIEFASIQDRIDLETDELLKYITSYNNLNNNQRILFSRLNYFCSISSIFWPGVFPAIFGNSQKMFELYAYYTSNIDDNLTKKLQQDARMILEKYHDARETKTINEIYLENFKGLTKDEFRKYFAHWGISIN